MARIAVAAQAAGAAETPARARRSRPHARGEVASAGGRVGPGPPILVVSVPLLQERLRGEGEREKGEWQGQIVKLVAEAQAAGARTSSLEEDLLRGGPGPKKSCL